MIASCQKTVNYAMYALVGQITLGKSWRGILTYHEVLLKKMTQIYMSCVFSALRYVHSYMYCDAVCKKFYTG